jgi:hypothetical protein
VESLAVANLATANFLAVEDRTGSPSSPPGFTVLPPSASLGFRPAPPISDFFSIAIFPYPFRANQPRPESDALQTTVVWNGIATSNVFAVDTLNGLVVSQHSEGGNNFAGLWLGAVNLRLHGLALGGSGSLLADERFLFHSHCGFSNFI